MRARKQVTGWHGAGTTLRDGSPRPCQGVTLRHDGEVVPCQSGYHLSVDPLDALWLTPGPWLAKVRGSGVCLPHGDPVNKWVCSRRRTLTRYVDATEVLREFARLCALRAARVHSADAIESAGLDASELRGLPDDASPDAIETAARAAWDAARAAWTAGWAAWTAAGDALDAALDAARAAGAAALDAARDAAREALYAALHTRAAGAAEDAERRWQSRLLRRMLTDATR